MILADVLLCIADEQHQQQPTSSWNYVYVESKEKVKGKWRKEKYEFNKK